jgi:hypothetical protein
MRIHGATLELARWPDLVRAAHSTKIVNLQFDKQNDKTSQLSSWIRPNERQVAG